MYEPVSNYATKWSTQPQTKLWEVIEYQQVRQRKSVITPHPIKYASYALSQTSTL